MLVQQIQLVRSLDSHSVNGRTAHQMNSPRRRSLDASAKQIADASRVILTPDGHNVVSRETVSIVSRLLAPVLQPTIPNPKLVGIKFSFACGVFFELLVGGDIEYRPFVRIVYSRTLQFSLQLFKRRLRQARNEVAYVDALENNSSI